jgi:hypothetical protein
MLCSSSWVKIKRIPPALLIVLLVLSCLSSQTAAPVDEAVGEKPGISLETAATATIYISICVS